MNRQERLVVYGLLGLLLAVNLATLSGVGARDATAETRWGADELGPASRLTLESDEDEADPVVVRNADGRIGWGDGAYQRAYSLACVNIDRIMKPLLQGDEFVDERRELAELQQEEDAEFRERMESLHAELQQMEPGTPEYQEQQGRMGELQQEYMGWSRQAMAARSNLDAEHIERAYREVINAVEVVADRRDIDLVFRFLTTEDEFVSQTREQAMMEAQLRSLVKYPHDLDITDDVLEELALEA